MLTYQGPPRKRRFEVMNAVTVQLSNTHGPHTWSRAFAAMIGKSLPGEVLHHHEACDAYVVRFAGTVELVPGCMIHGPIGVPPPRVECEKGAARRRCKFRIREGIYDDATGASLHGRWVDAAVVADFDGYLLLRLVAYPGHDWWEGYVVCEEGSTQIKF